MLARRVGLDRRALGLGLFDQCFLQAPLFVDICDGSLGSADIGLGLIKLGAVVIVHNLDQDVAGSNSLEILDEDAPYIAGNLAAGRCLVSPSSASITAFQT